MEKKFVVKDVDNLALSLEETIDGTKDISELETPEKSVILDIPETVIDGDEPARPEPTNVVAGQEACQTEA